MASPAAASTPAEFWRRWNRPAQQFLQEYAFRPAGGKHRPIYAIFVTFAVSAVVHEYVFGIATGMFQGWQALFFLSQGVATTLTFRSRPTGWGRALGTFLTILFNLAAAYLFFKSVDMIIPFYSLRTR
jgi:D-alanyl-lipoteichoic acid acyltransferase DltB (MBOAT superfamily)